MTLIKHKTLQWELVEQLSVIRIPNAYVVPVCVYERECVCECVGVCAHEHVCACVCACMCVCKRDAGVNRLMLSVGMYVD